MSPVAKFSNPTFMFQRNKLLFSMPINTTGMLSKFVFNFSRDKCYELLSMKKFFLEKMRYSIQ